MLRILLLSLLLISSHAKAFSQEQEQYQTRDTNQAGERTRARPDSAKIASLLNLTTEKAEQLNQIMLKHQQIRKEKWQQQQERRQKQYAEMKTERIQHQQELAAVLNEKELEIFDLYMQQFKPKRRHANKPTKPNKKVN